MYQHENTAGPEGLYQSYPISEVALCDAASTAVLTMSRAASPSACMVFHPLSCRQALNMSINICLLLVLEREFFAVLGKRHISDFYHEKRHCDVWCGGGGGGGREGVGALTFLKRNSVVNISN